MLARLLFLARQVASTCVVCSFGQVKTLGGSAEHKLPNVLGVQTTFPCSSGGDINRPYMVQTLDHRNILKKHYVLNSILLFSNNIIYVESQ